MLSFNVITVLMALIYQYEDVGAAGDSSTTIICKMTDDFTKSGVTIPSRSNVLDVGRTVYHYHLMWCDQETARQLIEHTNTTVFMVNCSKERKMNCQRHNVETHILHTGAHPGFTFREIFEMGWVESQSAKRVLSERYPQTKISWCASTANTTNFSTVFDPNWKIITDTAVVQEKANIPSFDPELMVFAEHKENGNQILLISDIHTSEKFSALQKQVISEWKPDAASIEMSINLWSKLENNPNFGHTEESARLHKCEVACSRATVLCGLFGICSGSKLTKVFAAAAMCAAHEAKERFAELCTGELRHVTGANMLDLLPLFNKLGHSSGSPFNLCFADFAWYFRIFDCKVLLEQLRAFESPVQLQNGDARVIASVSEAFELQKGQGQVLTFAIDAVKSFRTWKLSKVKSFSTEIDFISSVRSDLMYMSLMSLAQSRRAQKIVGVFGMFHVSDIAERLAGDSTDFFMQ